MSDTPGELTMDFLKYGTGWFGCKHKRLLPWRPATADDRCRKNASVTGFPPETHYTVVGSASDRWKCCHLQICADCQGIARVAETHVETWRNLAPRSVPMVNDSSERTSGDAWKCIFELVCSRCDQGLRVETRHDFQFVREEVVDDYPTKGGGNEDVWISVQARVKRFECRTCGTMIRNRMT